MIRSLKHSSLFILAAVVATTTTPALGAAWPPSVPCGSNCAGQPVRINYTIGNITDGSIKFPDETPWPAGLIRASIEEALHVWTTAVNVNFVEVPDGPLTQLKFRHVYINGGDPPPPADPIPKAQATCLGVGTDCEVQYDEGDRWQLAGTQANPDILGATIHEVGHILGLLHNDIAGTNMYWIFHRFPGLGYGQLYPDDMSRIRSLYGAGVGSVTPIPEPTSIVLTAVGALGCLPIRRRRIRS